MFFSRVYAHQSRILAWVKESITNVFDVPLLSSRPLSHAAPLQDHLMFPRMLMKLVSLRTLSSVHSEQVFALRLQDKKLPPLLSEIWDVHE